MQASQPTSFHSIIPPLHASWHQAIETFLNHFTETQPQTLAIVHHTAIAPSLCAMIAHAPYLTRLLQHHPHWLDIWQKGALDIALSDLLIPPTISLSTPEIMQRLRQAKAQLSLGLAMGDIAGLHTLKTTTRYLSDFAEMSIKTALRHALHTAHTRGDLTLTNPENPEEACGITVLGMGKLGAYELNYSSDIDLIVFFDKARLPYSGSRNAQVFMNKLAQELSGILQERTADGYVFRTDLRLRPDPMSTPPAISISAALNYYETVGQNWERAAMIKARHLAGDAAVGKAFLHEMTPYIWRKNLDFAAINDIHSIKRQMNVGHTEIVVPGHNIKTGIGGIREIEFFVQTQQLVWGGRNPSLRVRGTIEGLNALCAAELIDTKTRDDLCTYYCFLRVLEHRLQMREDAQTHTIPTSADDLAHVAAFCGYETPEHFKEATHEVLQNVHQIYAKSSRDTTPLAIDGNMVFTGVEADSDTLKTLEKLGYSEAQRISDIIQGWHRGSRKSTKSKRSRQILTEMVPAILTELAKSAHPDTAFFQFDDFIDRLPTGAQIFSLIAARSELLPLIAQILGSAPALGHTLGNNPLLLDAVLEPDFFIPLKNQEDLTSQLLSRLAPIQDYEQQLLLVRIFHNEKRFQAGVHMLKRLATPEEVSHYLSDLAELIVAQCLRIVHTHYCSAHAHIAATPLAILALGRLGAHEMLFGSDIDLVFIYDLPGEPGDIPMHMQRVCQRVISALTLMTAEGRLYEVDTRLRPGGESGPLATSLEAFDRYFETHAWTFERMALTKARVVASSHETLSDQLHALIREHLLRPLDQAILHEDVFSMRERMEKEHPTSNPWAVKHAKGGLVDIEFIAQYVVLAKAHSYPQLYRQRTRAVLEAALPLPILPNDMVCLLIEAHDFLTRCLSYQRLCVPGGVMTDHAPEGLKRLMTQSQNATTLNTLQQRILLTETRVRGVFDLLREEPLD